MRCSCFSYPLCQFSSILIPFITALTFSPSRISFHSVSQAYEDTLLRKLFSSVPRREFALKNFSLELQSGEFLILRGASSSGKSTILRLLSGMEEPVSGMVSIQSTSTPIYIDRKPDFNSQQTIQQILLARCENQDEGSSMLQHLCDLVGLEASMKPSDLTPSETYKYGLIDASMKSVIFKNPCSPILLLDEWMDLETSAVIHKVEATIQTLVKDAGAIVVCVTHKPHLFRLSHDCITMCQGEVLVRGRSMDLCY